MSQLSILHTTVGGGVSMSASARRVMQLACHSPGVGAVGGVGWAGAILPFTGLGDGWAHAP